MSPRIRPGLQGALSYLILVSLLIAAGNALVAPALEARQAKLERIAALQLQNGRFLQAREAYQRQIDDVRARPAPEADEEHHDRFLHAATTALAGARLQDFLRRMVDDAGDAQLVSAAFRRADEADVFPAITVNLRLQSSIPALHELLLAIETHEPDLFVDGIVVQSRHRAGRIIRLPAEQLEVRMDVTAYLDRSAREHDDAG